MAFINGVIGGSADFASTRTDNEGYAFGLGDIAFGSDGSAWVYVVADEAITGAGYAVLVHEDWGVEMVDTTSTASAFGQMVGVPAVAFASGDYGWIQVLGVCVVRGAASAAANTAINSTATPGQVDDDATAGAEVIDGMIFTTAVGGAAATQAAFLVWPKVGATL